MFIVGTSLINWFRLLYQNKFKISPKYIPKAILITLIILIFCPLFLVEKLLYTKKIKNTQIIHSPIFILGHWRTGTTFLHELLIRDPKHEYMTLTESIFPNHFLCFSKFLHWFMDLVLPETRPQDAVKVSPKLSSEHDIAITNLCLMSPYSGIYFPNNQEYYNRYVTFEDTSKKDRTKLKNCILMLVKKLSRKKESKRLVLKSPIDLGRIPILLELFPSAKFIHIYRNPYHVFYSTKRMYNKLISMLQLQERKVDLSGFVFNTFTQLYDKFYSDLDFIPNANYVEISYEDLINNPLNELEKIYNHLSLAGFNKARPFINEYLKSIEDYEPSSYTKKPKEWIKIYREWADIIKKLGYNKPGQSNY